MRSAVLPILALFMLTLNAAQAHNTVVVLPFDDPEPPQGEEPPLPALRSVANLINVSMHGNGDFTSLPAAMQSISGASINNPFIIVMAEGDYLLTSTLTVKPFVSIRGMGKAQTKLLGSIGSQSLSSSAILRGANGSTISALTIENIASLSANKAMGIYNNSVENEIRDVDILIRNASTNYGVYNNDSAVSLVNTKVDVKVGAQKRSYGVYNVASESNNQALILEASGNSGSRGLYANSSSTLIVGNSNISLTNSSTHALYLNNGSVGKVTNTQLDGNHSTPSGTQCFHVFRPNNFNVNC